MLSKILVSSLLLEAATAFPHIAEMVAKNQLEERLGVPSVVPFPEYPGSPSHALYDSFDPVAQLVSVHGEHRFIPPGPNDIRGPCAGLNAAANHGYLPRSGIANATAIAQGLWELYGLDHTATTFLETATRFFDGDPVSGRWSIGYYSPKPQSLGVLGDLLGNETGICAYGHLKTEGDASITRGDWLAPTMNSNCASYPQFAQELLDLAKKRTGGLLTPPVMAEHQYNRKLHSIATNPNYFSPAYAGVAFTFGAHMFAFELLGNHSAEYPRGFLEPHVFESFFSYKRDKQGNLVYTYGHERIPENWYRRAAADAWTLVDIGVSTAQNCASYPLSCNIGGNVGKTHSFVGVNIADVTGGLIGDYKELSKPAKMACFITQTLQAEVPSFLDKTFTAAALTEALGLVSSLLPKALAPLKELGGGCKNLPAGRTQAEYGSSYSGAQYVSSGPRNPKTGK